jgi:hypothetical protein
MSRDDQFYAFESRRAHELSRNSSQSTFDVGTPQGPVTFRVTTLIVVEIIDDNIDVIDLDCQSCQFGEEPTGAPTARLPPKRRKR